MDTWTSDTTISSQPGEAGGYFVSNVSNSLKAYLKPTSKCPPNHPRAALEKIASDIAYELDLPVPPVQLYRRTVTIPEEEHRTCLSLQIYPLYYEWDKILDLSALEPIVRGIINTSLSNSSGLIALDLYLAQTDRESGRNVIWGTYGSNSEYSGFVFLDFANSMNYNNHWVNQGWNRINPRIPKIMLDSINKVILAQTTEKIRNLSENILTAIVNRIDPEFLNTENKEIILTGLTKRRTLVADYIRGNYFRN